MVAALIITLVFAYLAGSLPTGFLVARAMRVDITQVGSGNIGATNVFRVLGKGPGALVLIVDLLKGALAVLVAPILAAAVTPTDSLALPALAALGAVLGHNYTCWLGFKGGKGVATSAGAMAALIPPAFGVTVITWLLVFFLSRYVSMASIAAAVILPVATIFTVSGPTRWPLVAFTSALAALAVWRHRANIERLKAGTEHRINKSKLSAS
ncbi:MAG: glycerol-3-phosphate 1-O-acyltransferase PlsY [Verrucomicrobia bacterium]|jgi:glycerol-3-phosphate acyltransferase PlsY|nr:glycerol-3-phosphate 1-O-acyltransferase PlsY [Verrucomicrobiota bacterium]